MRAVTYRLSADAEPAPVAGGAFEGAGVPPATIHAVNPLVDDTVVLHLEVAAEADRLRDRLAAAAPVVRQYAVEAGDDAALVQLQVRPDGVLGAVLRAHRTAPVVIDFPVEVVAADEGDAVRVVAVGALADVRTVIEGLRERVAVTVEAVGDYDPAWNRPFRNLTDRQQQVLRTAIEKGYYDVPRDVTYEDIARELDCSAGTVGQHLRRIEAAVFRSVVPDAARSNRRPRPVH